MKKSAEEKLLEAIEKKPEREDQSENELMELSSIDDEQLETAAKRIRENFETRKKEQ